jgi:hypothetical protein
LNCFRNNSSQLALFFGFQNYDKNNSYYEGKKLKILAHFLVGIKKIHNPKFS